MPNIVRALSILSGFVANNALNRYKKLENNEDLNKITLILLSVFSTIGICIGGYFLIFRLEVPIQYNEKLIGVRAIEDRMMEFKFLENDFYR